MLPSRLASGAQAAKGEALLSINFHEKTLAIRPASQVKHSVTHAQTG